MSYYKALKNTLSFYVPSALGWRIKPMKLRLAVTNRCNSRCAMCNVWQLEHKPEDELSIEEYEKLFHVNTAFFSNLNHISLTGGDPLLREDLDQIIRLVHRFHPRASININTNGFLTKRLISLADSMANEKIRIAFNISLDGMGEKHDEMRGVANAGKMAMESINQLLELKGRKTGIKFNINQVITNQNVEECAKVYEFCRQNKIGFNPIVPNTGELYNKKDRDGLDLTPENRQALSVFFRRALTDQSPDNILGFIDVLDQIEGRPRDYRCWAGTILFLIEENGDVFPNGGCPAAWRLGNLRESDYSLHEILKTNHAREIMKRIRRCSSCRIACESLTSLKYPEALKALKKMRMRGIRGN